MELIFLKEKEMHTNNVKLGHRSKQSYANTRTTGKEQYYTKRDVVDLCIAEVERFVDLSTRVIIEPCGGTGEFIEGFLRAGIGEEKIISYDIDPAHRMVMKGDYLKQDLSHLKGAVSITNPPFGRASSLAKKFFNRDAQYCDYICYLIPRSWRKWTVHNSLDSGFRLLSDIELPKNCFYLPDGSEKPKDVLNTIFQVWSRSSKHRQKIKIPDNGLIKKILPEVDKDGNKVVKGANFSIIAFGHSCGKCTEITEETVPYKTTTMYLNVPDLKTRHALQCANLSKFYNNVAYVQALSIQEINYELNRIFELPNYQFE